MEKNIEKSHEDDHDLPPQDEATRNKIDKHLSDINDTISEEDLKNVNTSTGREKTPAVSHKEADEENEIDDEPNDDDDDELKEEMPTAWDIKS
ncbi:MAG TPA: hypothetical protein VGP43_04070 [Chitinophagaceae bacterium]|nr:hypothetical protein [Chitinophagaceae bacterium]